MRIGRDNLKKAFYHIMKMEQKRNRKTKFDGYKKVNARLNKQFSCGEYFDNGIIYVEDGGICVRKDFFRLRGSEQEAVIKYMAQVAYQNEITR